MKPESNVIQIPARRRAGPPLMEIEDLSLWYGEKRALDCVSFDILPHEILAFVGPRESGKTTALKCLNRMHDGTPDVRIEGQIRMGGGDVLGRETDPALHRRRFGWVARRPNPVSIFESVAYAARVHGEMRSRSDLADHVERCLRRVGLWDQVKDDLHSREGAALPSRQQMRLCLAQALASEPEVLLIDEPSGAADPRVTAQDEALLLDLKADHSVVIVTQSLMQARRLSDRVAYFHLGRLLELREAEAFFAGPSTPEARAFVEGRMG